MTDVALQTDCLVVSAEVLAVVAAEAAREVLVPDVVGMRLPVDVHEREGRLVEDRLQASNRLLHVSLAAVVHVGIGVLVEIGHTSDGLSRLFFGGVRALQNLRTLRFDGRQVSRYRAGGKRLVEGCAWPLEVVARPVVTVNAIHLALFGVGDVSVRQGAIGGDCLLYTSRCV